MPAAILTRRQRAANTRAPGYVNNTSFCPVTWSVIRTIQNCPCNFSGYCGGSIGGGKARPIRISPSRNKAPIETSSTKPNYAAGRYPTTRTNLGEGLRRRMAWPEVRAAVLAHFELTPEGWRNGTLDRVMRVSVLRQTSRSDTGSGRGGPCVTRSVTRKVTTTVTRRVLRIRIRIRIRI